MRYLFVMLAFVTTLLCRSEAIAQNVMSVTETRYSYGDGTPAFTIRRSVLDNLGFDAILEMDSSNEVWTLQRSQGAGGAVIYKNDTGRVFLRTRHRRSAILYPTPESLGVPVLKTAEYSIEVDMFAKIEKDQQLNSIEEWSRVYEYAGNKKEKAQKYENADNVPDHIKFPEWPHSQSEFKTSLISHLSSLVTDDLAENINRIVVKVGEKPAAFQDNTDLIIWVNPELGYAGRPSTEKIRADLINKSKR